jgi:Zn-dependent protease with chaperone function
MGAFSIYLWVGVFELREYPVLNKILIITLVTYNVIFIAGLVSFYLENPFYVNTAFAFSFWIILILGFILFGRKYIVVWRFMSPAYLLLFLYIIAWLAIIFINQYTPLEFLSTSPLSSDNPTPLDFIMNIYFVLIVVNWIVYFISGIILDKLLGIKRVKDDKEFLEIVENVKKDIGIKGKVKVGFGKYPILNALAYGPFFDKRIAIIAEDINQIPKDEMKGIVAHELAHTKGKHTLILTFITTGDLVFRMLVGLPATYYDYTFGNPQIPLIAFIFINLLIFIFLFVFVRILEGKADLKSKKAGYGEELVKALYNLESFYATGREFGLNTMLLCEEKITRNNQILDYLDTAHYIHNSLIRPKRGSLLANFMNSHPPTYFNELKPAKESILQFVCLKRAKQKKYAKKFNKARLEFKIIANEKFKEIFNISDISIFLESIGRRELYRHEMNKEYIFKQKITGEIEVGKLEDVQFLDDVCDSDQYIVQDIKTAQKLHLNASLYNKIQINLKATYFFKNNFPLILEDIQINEDKMDGNYIFSDKNINKIVKSIKKTKLPISVKNIMEFKDQDVFLKLKGELKIFKCLDIIPADEFEDYKFIFKDSISKRISDEESLTYKLGDLIIRPRDIYFSISRNIDFRKSEINLLDWLLNNELRTFIYLKKPVNNLEVGKILQLNVGHEKIKKSTPSKEDEFILIRNIFGDEVTIPYKKLELITFEVPSAMIQKKSETSLFSRFGYKILHKIKPEKVVMIQ